MLSDVNFCTDENGSLSLRACALLIILAKGGGEKGGGEKGGREAGEGRLEELLVEADCDLSERS